MKKNIITFIIILLTFIPINVYAEEYKLDINGNYSVKEAFCTYEYNISGFDYKFKIELKEEKINNVDSNMGKYKETVYLNTLKYSDFFENKQFTCPKTVDVNYLAMPSQGLRQGYHLEVACDEETLGRQCNRANLIVTETGIRYNPKGENDGDTIPKTEQLACAYQKITTNSISAQLAAPTHLDYKKYTDNTHTIMDRDNYEYDISDGSLTTCPSELYITLEFQNKKIDEINIVDSCNDSTNTKCVVYRRVDLTNNPDSTLGADGNSGQQVDKVDPDTIPKIDMDLPIDFDTTQGCESYLGNPKDNVNKPPAYYLQFSFNLMKYIAIILLFVLTVMEYAKAVASSNQDAIKKATMNTVKRIILAAVIFMLPMLIEFLFKVLGIYSSTTCGIK